MGFFRHQRRDGPVLPDHHRSSRRDRHRRHHESYSMSKRPSFGQWLKLIWLDILTMIIMGAVGLGVSERILSV